MAGKKMMFVSYEVLADLVLGRMAVLYDFPTDTKWLRGTWCPERDAFVLVFESEAWEPVAEGAVIPQIHAMVQQLGRTE